MSPDSFISFLSSHTQDYLCLEDVYLSSLDRLIFLIGGPMILIATTFLMIAAVRFKEVRTQPGDLILGLAVSDFILAIHWIILAVRPEEISSETFCKSIGTVSTFAGVSEFIYNVAFSIFLLASLKNVLTQSRIPRKGYHLLIIVASVSVTLVCLLTGNIGRTQVGTCSIKSTCEPGFSSYFGLGITIIYAALGILTYFYIRKHAPHCQRAHSRRTTFLMYYLCYIIASITIYFIIAALNFAQSLIYSIDSDSGTDIKEVLKSVYNASKLCSPLVLTIVRYNDPLIRKAMRKTICFWVKKKDPSLLLIHTEGTEIVQSRIDIDSSVNSFEFTLNQLSTDKKIELTYTLLACVMYAYEEMAHKISDMSRSMKLFNHKPSKQFKQEQTYLVDDESLKKSLPNVREELERKNLSMLPGSLKVYAPKVFSRLVGGVDYYDVLASLDFQKNVDQIKAAGRASGKSGQFFFFSADKKLVIKTIRERELDTLISILEDYEKHFQKYPHSLITKIYGAFTYVSTEYNIRYHLILIQNTCGFPTEYVDRIYDLKGSRDGREVLKGQEVTNRANLRNFVLKDLDFEKYEEKLYLTEQARKEFLKQIEIDSQFFRSVRLIDYSLVVFYVQMHKFREDIQEENYIDLSQHNQLSSLENIQNPEIYYNFGIIDYLQPYTFRKAFEKFIKRLVRLNPRLEISTQNPQYYSERFINFITRITL